MFEFGAAKNTTPPNQWVSAHLRRTCIMLVRVLAKDAKVEPSRQIMDMKTSVEARTKE